MSTLDQLLGSYRTGALSEREKVRCLKSWLRHGL